MKQKIIPPRRSPTVDPQEVWPLLHSAFKDILQLQHAQWAYSQLYNTAYNLVLAKHAQFLYDGIGSDIKEYLISNVRPQLVHLVKRVDQDNTISVIDQGKTLKDIKSIWDDYLIAIQLISYVALYLDRTYVKENKMPSIYDLGLNTFREVIIDFPIDDVSQKGYLAPTIGEQLIKLVLSYYNKARRGEFVDKSLLKSSIGIFESLIDEDDSTSYYKKYFESSFLLDSHKYYIEKAQQLLNSTDASSLGSTYISNTLSFISHEISLQTLHISNDTIPTLQNLLFTDLILTPMPNVLSLNIDGLSDWVSNEDFETLHDSYTLLGKCQDNQDILRAELRKLIISMGSDIIQNAWGVASSKEGESNSTNIRVTFATEIINNFINLRAKFLRIIEKSFDSNGGISREVDGAFSTVINESDYDPSVEIIRGKKRGSNRKDSSEGRFQEYLSLYIDSIIKKLDPNDLTLESSLNSSINLLRYVKDKDIFEKYYRNHLARRLLNVNSRSSRKSMNEDELDVEINMITKLQNDNGSSFTSSLEGMIKDIKSSKVIGSSFEDLSEESTMNITPIVLTTVYWPNQPMDITDINFPQEMLKQRVNFENWYMDKHPGRKLRWCNIGGTVVGVKSVLKMKDGKTKQKNVDVQMPPLCACILSLCFNDEEEINVQSIQQRTGIELPDLLRHLYGLMSGRTKLIIPVTPMPELNLQPETVLKANPSWRCKEPKAKVVVPSNLPKSNGSMRRSPTADSMSVPTHLETNDEHSKTIDSIHSDRAHHVDAALVRVMKSRKELKHQELIVEVMRLVKNRFEPKVSLIKERIGELIELEYIRRTDDGGYEYVA